MPACLRHCGILHRIVSGRQSAVRTRIGNLRSRRTPETGEANHVDQGSEMGKQPRASVHEGSIERSSHSRGRRSERIRTKRADHRRTSNKEPWQIRPENAGSQDAERLPAWGTGLGTAGRKRSVVDAPMRPQERPRSGSSVLGVCLRFQSTRLETAGWKGRLVDAPPRSGENSSSYSGASNTLATSAVNPSSNGEVAMAPRRNTPCSTYAPPSRVRTVMVSSRGSTIQYSGIPPSA